MLYQERVGEKRGKILQVYQIAKARQRLDEINTAIATHRSELASLNAVLRAASERPARRHAARFRSNCAMMASAFFRSDMRVFLLCHPRSPIGPQYLAPPIWYDEIEPSALTKRRHGSL